MFKGITKKVCKSGKGTIKQYDEITPGDLIKIQDYFTRNLMNKPDPKKLQHCVLFYIIFFCHRGRENIYGMQVNTFNLYIDSNGKQFVYQDIQESDKNHGTDYREPANQGRMYENPSKKS